MLSRKCLLGLMIVAALMPFGSTQASEGELEWESVPRPGIIVVRYNEGIDTETGRVHQNLRVRIFDAPADSVYEVFVKDRRIGVVRTDNEGSGELIIDRTVSASRDGRPPVRRRIDTGDRCVVKNGELLVWDVFARIP